MISIQTVIAWIFLLTMYPISPQFLTMKVIKLTKEEFIKGNKLRQLNDKQEQKDKQYCYKPYRTIYNY